MLNLTCIYTVSFFVFCFTPWCAGLPYELCLLVYRYFFPLMLAVLVTTGLAALVVGQVRHLYETVKNDKCVAHTW